MKEFFKKALSVLRALIRLYCVSFLFVLDGSQKIIFDNFEIYSFEFLTKPLSVDDDRIAYLEKLDNMLGINEGIEYAEDDYSYEEDDEEDNR